MELDGFYDWSSRSFVCFLGRGRNFEMHQILVLVTLSEGENGGTEKAGEEVIQRACRPISASQPHLPQSLGDSTPKIAKHPNASTSQGSSVQGGSSVY